MLDLNNFIIAGRFFLVIAGELILIFVAVSFLIGLLTEYLPPSRIRDYLAGKLSLVQYVLGAGLGALTPFCSCSTVPITAGLLKGGVPFGPVMAFLFASPVLNPFIVALLLSLFGVNVTVFYVVVTFFGSMAVATLMSRMGMEDQVKPLIGLESTCCSPAKKPVTGTVKIDAAGPGFYAPVGASSLSMNLPMFAAVDDCCSSSVQESVQESAAPCCSVDFSTDGKTGPAGAPVSEKMKRASRSAIVTFKGVFWYLLLGAGIGAFIYGFFPQDLIVRLAGPGNPWSIPIAALIGVPMYIRAETIIPISAALVGKGMGLGTVLALIVGGAGASIPELIILGSMFRKKLIVTFVLNVFLVAMIAGYLVDLVLY
ncbi:MAG: permease [Syntrophales bacterium]|nr:permease [Syntrophales bacterium]HOG08278.1 permease [Syntrophales bacterium]HOS77525.1 permease [Syntrophales bacterium]HPB70813.1 permease [Syntrophales bacterium]HQN26079.1 permease [Syntrophales bacterium]